MLANHAGILMRNLTFDEAYFAHLRRTLSQGTIDTVYMVGFSSLFALSIGLLLGIMLYLTAPGCLYASPKFNRILGIIINIGRSIPFVIIVIAVFPLARFIVGTSIGRTAAIVPLTIAAIPFTARIVEVALNELGRGIIEAAIAAGATPLQIVLRVLLPESASSIVLGFTLTIINLISLSAMAGIIGGGGLGDIALRYGHQRFRTDILILTVIILIILVQIIQFVGQFLARRLDKR